MAERTVQLEQSLESFVCRMRQSAQTLSVLERQKVVRLLVKEIVVEVDNRITIRHCLPLMGGVRNASGLNLDCYLLCTGGHDAALRRARLRREKRQQGSTEGTGASSVGFSRVLLANRAETHDFIDDLSVKALVLKAPLPVAPAPLDSADGTTGVLTKNP